MTRDWEFGFQDRHGLLGWFVLAALVLHSGLLFIVDKLDIPLSTKSLPRFVELFEDDRAVVQTIEIDDGSNGKAKYLGERRNRVSEESRAARRGLHQSQSARRSDADSARDEFGTLPPRELSMRQLTQLGQSPHEVDRSIREGAETILNTDSVYYASFLNRITDAIYPAWMRHLREAGEMLKLDRNPDALRQPAYVTRLSVEMDSQGNILSVQVVKSSGITEFDDAPKAAIWEKEPFRNPPAQMFEDEQSTFKFDYIFTVEMQRSLFSVLPQISL